MIDTKLLLTIARHCRALKTMLGLIDAVDSTGVLRHQRDYAGTHLVFIAVPILALFKTLASMIYGLNRMGRSEDCVC